MPANERVNYRTTGPQINGSNTEPVNGRGRSLWLGDGNGAAPRYYPVCLQLSHSAHVLNFFHLQPTPEMANPTTPRRRFRLRYIAAFLALLVSVIIGAFFACVEGCNVTPFVANYGEQASLRATATLHRPSQITMAPWNHDSDTGCCSVTPDTAGYTGKASFPLSRSLRRSERWSRNYTHG